MSNPLPEESDVRPSWALLEADSAGHRVTLHRVGYDGEAVVRAIGASHFFPNPEWLARRFARGTPLPRTRER